MTVGFRALAIVLAVVVSAPVAAQIQSPPDKNATPDTLRVDRAKERCRLNHGVDCDTPEGLKEWLLLERSREEAVREGSRHPLPAQRKPAPSRP